MLKFARYLKKHYQCRHIIDLKRLFTHRHLLSSGNKESLSIKQKINESVMICTDLIEYMTNPYILLDFIRYLLDHARVCLISTPDRELSKACSYSKHNNIPARWSLNEFELLLLGCGLNVEHSGITVSRDTDRVKNTGLCVVEGTKTGIGKVPGAFKVIAIMASYNEEDIIFHSIKRLIDQGIYVYVIDNWSNDATGKILESFEGNAFFLGSEKFPPEGPDIYFSLYDLIKRKEELSNILKADWFINYDVDEVRESPWPGITLKEGIYRVDRLGFNAINHTELTFWPVDNGFSAEHDFHSYFKYCSFIYPHLTEYFHVKAWKNTGRPISMADTAGHEVTFEGRRVYPYKFLLKHYPIRSQKHGEKKIFKERKPRYSPDEINMGWHIHYDVHTEGCSFIRNPGELLFFDRLFYKKYFLERLTGEIMRL